MGISKGGSKIILLKKCSNFKIWLHLYALVFIVLVGGCATSGITYDIRGEVRENLYLSPDRSFQVQIPKLTRPGAKIQDRILENNVQVVWFSDDFCGQHAIVATTANLGNQPLDSWVDQYFLPNLRARLAGFLVLERKNVETRRGPAVYLFGRIPKNSPCVHMTSTGLGGWVKEEPDSWTAIYIIHYGGHIYQINYTAGIGGLLDLFSEKIPNDKLEAEKILLDKLNKFFEGFETTSERTKIF